MGGFVVVQEDCENDRLPPGTSRVTLGLRDIKFIAESHIDLLPNLTESQIKDKSNVGALAKSLVCIQAFWFCGQCIVRLAMGFSISFLELKLNTFAHAVCAFVIYGLWWKKPSDIDEPTQLKGPLLGQVLPILLLPRIRLTSFGSGRTNYMFVISMRSPGCQENLSVLRKPWLRHIQQFGEGQTLHHHYLQRHERIVGTLESFAQGSLGNGKAEADDHILLTERDMMLMELTLKASVPYKAIKDLEADSMKAYESGNEVLCIKLARYLDHYWRC